MSRLKRGPESEWKMIPAPDQKFSSQENLPGSSASAAAVVPSETNALVEYSKPVLKEEEEDLEVKLRRIIDHVPVRVSNTSGSSAGSGSGDFHQMCHPNQSHHMTMSSARIGLHKANHGTKKMGDIDSIDRLVIMSKELLEACFRSALMPLTLVYWNFPSRNELQQVNKGDVSIVTY